MANIEHSIITGTIFLLGFFTVVLSIYSCIKFDLFTKKTSKDASKLSKAISWQLAGEAVIGLGTLVFTTAEFMGVLSGWDYHVTSTLRFVMFFATAVTTLHLVRTISYLSE